MVTAVTHDASDALPASVWALVAARAANRLGAFSLSFLAVVLVDDLGATVGQAGAVVAAFGVATLPSRVAGGWLADRWGAVPTIVVGLVGCALAQLAVAASPGLVWASVGAVLLGLAFELYEPPSQALVADLTTDAQRPRAYGLLAAALAGAGAVAGLLAAALGGLDLRWLLVADAASCLVAAVLVVAAVREPDVGFSRVPVSLAEPWRDRRLLALLAVGTAFAVVYLALVVALPLTLGVRGLPPERTGLVLTASALTVVLGQPLLRLRALADPLRAMTVGHVVLAAGLLGTGVATSMLGFLAAAVVWSVGDLLLLGHFWTAVAGLAPPGSRASYLAVFGLSWGVAGVVAPLVSTQLLAHGGPAVLWTALAALALVLAGVTSRLTGVLHATPAPHDAR